jgi:hypothetical protein
MRIGREDLNRMEEVRIIENSSFVLILIRIETSYWESHYLFL